MPESYAVLYDCFRDLDPRILTPVQQANRSIHDKDSRVLYRGTEAQCEAFVEGYRECMDEHHTEIFGMV